VGICNKTARNEAERSEPATRFSSSKTRDRQSRDRGHDRGGAPAFAVGIRPFPPQRTSEVLMIERYSDHAANERTFLAWVRTGIAVIAFGFVVEKFNLFVQTLAETNGGGSQLPAGRLSGKFSHYDGLTLILIGMAIILLSLLRFIRTSRLIDDQRMHSAGSVRLELALAVVLALIVAAMTVYFALF
jgi:putative membrane protein